MVCGATRQGGPVPLDQCEALRRMILLLATCKELVGSSARLECVLQV
jgi:hypothetical protein